MADECDIIGCEVSVFAEEKARFVETICKKTPAAIHLPVIKANPPHHNKPTDNIVIQLRHVPMTPTILRKKENLFYILLFALLFMSPVVAEYVNSQMVGHGSFRWKDVLDVWRIFAIYLAAFIVHNALAAPILIYKQQKLKYALSVMALMVVFFLAQCATRPDFAPPHDEHFKTEMAAQHHAPHHDKAADQPCQTAHRTPAHPPKGPRHGPPLLFGQTDVVGGIMLFFMLGLNLGVKLYFKQDDVRQQIAALERENLTHQLEFLRYQINPHFFMNTLNNIHALVDIDPERAKSSIVVLSKMMRYVLYEGNKKLIPLGREIGCLNNYVALMRMRYTDRVSISLDLPQPAEGEDRQPVVPPLLFITFVENAFKHGVSYQRDSFIDISIEQQDDRVLFSCRNSIAHLANSEKGGVGLANVGKRLQLIYGTDYDLQMADEDGVYSVKLLLPANTAEPTAAS